MTEDEFDKFLDNCYQELEDKQASLFSDYNLGMYDEYWFDQTGKSIQFKINGKVELEFDIVLIGSWSGKRNSWMWAWANKSDTDELRQLSSQIKELKNYTGYGIFEKEAFEATEVMAHELTAMAVHFLKALGMYIVPVDEHLKMFLALLSKR